MNFVVFKASGSPIPRNVLGHDMIVHHEHLPEAAAWRRLPIRGKILEIACAMLAKEIHMRDFSKARCV